MCSTHNATCCIEDNKRKGTKEAFVPEKGVLVFRRAVMMDGVMLQLLSGAYWYC